MCLLVLLLSLLNLSFKKLEIVTPPISTALKLLEEVRRGILLCFIPWSTMAWIRCELPVPPITVTKTIGGGLELEELGFCKYCAYTSNKTCCFCLVVVYDCTNLGLLRQKSLRENLINM